MLLVAEAVYTKKVFLFFLFFTCVTLWMNYTIIYKRFEVVCMYETIKLRMT